MVIGRSALVISLLASSTINGFPLKIMINEWFALEMGSCNNILISLIMIILQTYVCYNFTHITTIISIAGSFTVTIIAITIPGFMGVKIKYFRTNMRNQILLYGVVMFTIVCILGTS